MKKNEFLKRFLSTSIVAVIALNTYSQVTIGSADPPMKGSILHIKTDKDAASIGGKNAIQGIGLPRVELSKHDELFPMFLADPNNPASGRSTAYNTDKENIDKLHTGLLVYNIGNSFMNGVYYWSGTEWLYIDNVVSKPATIGDILCNNISVDKQKLVNGEYFETLVRVPYTNGNGAIYPAGPIIDCRTDNSSYVTGLKAQLQSGKLANGAGELVYRVWADPTVVGSSPNVAKFDISFPSETGTVFCSLEIGNTAFAEVISHAAVGPLVPTTPDTDNGVIGYERVITTPDGKWSVRAFVPKGGAVCTNGWTVPTGDVRFEDVDINIRANNMDIDREIMWTASVIYQDGDYSGTGTCTINKDIANNVWGGSHEGVTNAGRSSNVYWTIYPRTSSSSNTRYQVAWSNANVFHDNTPENRIYTWTEITPGKTGAKVVYTLTFMMGVSGDSRTPVNDNNINNSTVYFKIEQATSIE